MSAINNGDAAKRRRASFIKLCAMGGFTAAVIAVLTLSWFASNKAVNGEGMGVSVQTDKYQVYPVSTGSASIFNSFLTDNVRSADALVWNMTANSNMKNYDSTSDLGISPGSYGSLSFLVKPSDSSVTLDLTFQVMGYSYSAETTDPETGDVTPASLSPVNDGQELLAGHICFFQTRNIEYYTDDEGHNTDMIKNITYSDPILSQSGSSGKVILSKTFLKVNENTPTEIFWVWPKTLSTLVYAKGYNENVSIEPFCNSSAYSALVSDITSNPARYFFGYTAGASPLTESSIVADYDTYGSMFDQADNFIGNHVDYVVVKMTTNESAAN